MQDREFDSINVIPLVDVMLVLLTIVLTTSTFIASGALQLALPKAEAEKVEQLQSMTIEIDSMGRLYLNSRETALEGLESSLRPLARDMAVIIRADRAVMLQRFVDVLDLAKRMGFSRISLQTEHKP
jgi:biopolymer transport protein ExbD